MLETFSTGLSNRKESRWLPSSNSTTFCFWEYKSNLFVQIATTSRETVKRSNVTAASRKSTAAAREEVLDTIESWDNLFKYCSKFSPEHFVDFSDPTNIKILNLESFPPEVNYSLY